MLSHLLNPAMLLGLAGLALPVLAHLLSRRNYDVVHWGAMQFLELSRKTKRHIRLEEVLLLLLRMGVIGLLVAALARPWVSGGALGRYFSTRSRDVVFVIDGSMSMGWEGQTLTPHATAIRQAQDFLGELRPGDTAGLLDARDLVRPIISPPVGGLSRIRDALDRLPPPGGGSDLVEALSEAVRVLAGTSNLSRDVIVLTDGQARPWFADQAERWAAFDDLCEQAAVRPRIWVVDVTGGAGGTRLNFSLDNLQPSREFTAVNLPVRVKTRLRYTGGAAPMQRRVYLEVDGQRLADATLQTPLLQPGGEFSIEFEQRLTSAGSHWLGVVIDPDDLPGDNRADAAISVIEALPVLLVDGDPRLDPARGETFFLQAAFATSDNEPPLVRARVVDQGLFAAADLAGVRIVVLANVPWLTPAVADALANFVAAGGGLLVAPGDKVDRQNYHELLYRDGRGPLPAALDEVRHDDAESRLGVQIANRGLTLPLVTPLKRERDGGFTEARFSKWWKLSPATPAAAPPGPIAPGDESPVVAAPVVAAHLDTGDAYLVLGGYGRGRVALLAAPLDSDWSTLPAKPDYVPFLYELMFHLAGGGAPNRNVQTGEPLVSLLPRPLEPDEKCLFEGPGRTAFPAVIEGAVDAQFARLDDTRLPGLYTLRHEGSKHAPAAPEYFVVNFDRGESDLTPLDDDARKQLAGVERLKFITAEDALADELFADDARVEIWRVLLGVLLLLFAGELWFTRRLVRGGYATGLDPPPGDWQSAGDDD